MEFQLFFDLVLVLLLAGGTWSTLRLHSKLDRALANRPRHSSQVQVIQQTVDRRSP